MSSRDLLDYVGLVPLLPLFGAFVLLVFGRRLGEPKAGWLATGLVGLSFAWSVVMFVALHDLPEHARHHTVSIFTWVPAGGLHVKMGFFADPLSTAFILFVTGVAALIHLYAIGYMRGDERFSRFFAYLNLFVASMLILVLGSSFLVTFVGWEGVGLCSYLLISFWFERRGAATAGKKAFITTRIGDVGFMIAMFLIFQKVGSLDYSRLDAAKSLSSGAATVIALLLFLGAIGKSAQFPLHVWLPDAMEGPTPVSALIHAATMVTAGVFLIARAHPYFEAGRDAMTVVAWVGGLTALLAGTVAMVQPDIKRVLAYSTISQIGYMFLALGVGAYAAAIFHVVTHAFFKATLFLGTGSVIHGNGDNQDMRIMGGFRKYMPLTSAGMTIAWLAIAGVPPFSGFWSKDEILAQVYLHDEYALWIVGLVAAILTGLYMTRLILLTFGGAERSRVAALPVVSGGSEDAPPDVAAQAHAEAVDGENVKWDPEEPTVQFGEAPRTSKVDDHHPPHESPPVMTMPVLVLAALAAIGGFLFIPLKGLEFLADWLRPSFEDVVEKGPGTFLGGFGLSSLSVILAAVGIAVAFRWYRRGIPSPAEDPLIERLGTAGQVFGHAYYFDETIASAFSERGIGRRLAEWLRTFDERVIDGAVNGIGMLVRQAALVLRRVQSGLVRNYAAYIAIGAAALLLFLLLYAGR